MVKLAYSGQRIVKMAGKKNTKVKEENKKIEELENQVKRSLADYQNLEKRTAEERVGWIKQANKDLILRLLPVLDTLMLAAKHTNDQSITVSIKQFQDVLRGEGIERIEAIGKLFDPLIMEAIGTKEGKEWEVLEEVKPGYKLGEIILRPAYVIVGKKGDSESSSE